jgi:IS1 family transposase
MARGPRELQRVNLLQRFLRGLPEEVTPKEQHEATGKEEGETCHDVERWINTLMQRLSRFVHKTLSFSKSHRMHYYCCLKLFIYRYNLERRNIILE